MEKLYTHKKKKEAETNIEEVNTESSDEIDSSIDHETYENAFSEDTVDDGEYLE